MLNQKENEMSIYNCMMQEIIGNETYCGLFDAGCVICDPNTCTDIEDDDDDGFDIAEAFEDDYEWPK